MWSRNSETDHFIFTHSYFQLKIINKYKNKSKKTNINRYRGNKYNRVYYCERYEILFYKTNTSKQLIGWSLIVKEYKMLGLGFRGWCTVCVSLIWFVWCCVEETGSPWSHLILICCLKLRPTSPITYCPCA